MLDRLSIRNKLILIQMVLVILILLISGVVLTYSQRQALFDSKMGNLNASAKMIALNSTAPLQFLDHSAAKALLYTLQVEKDVLNAVLLDHNQTEFSTYHRKQDQESSTFIQPKWNGKDTAYFEKDYLIIQQTIKTSGQDIGYLWIKADTEDVDNALMQYIQTASMVLLTCLVLAFFFAVIFSKAMIKPLKSLITKVNWISTSGKYDTVMEETGRDELGELAAAFNTMMAEVKKRDDLLWSTNVELEQRVKERTQRLEEINESLQQYIYIAHHDLRSPLRAISSLATWIEEEMEGEMNEDSMQHFVLLKGRVKRMEALLDSMVAFAAIDTMKEQLASVDLTQIVTLIKHKIDETGTSKIIVKEESGPWRFDIKKLNLLLQHLLENAIFYCDKPFAEITVTARKSGTDIEIEVRDNGPGIDPQFHEKIFKPLTVLESRDKIERAGMGLAIVRKIVDQVKGKIRISSVVGEGTIMTVVLPHKPLKESP